MCTSALLWAFLFDLGEILRCWRWCTFIRAGGGLIRIPKSSIRRYMHFGEGYTIIPDYGILTPGSVLVKGHMHFGEVYYTTGVWYT